MDTRQLNGREKAAVLMVSLGPDLSAQVMNHLPEEDMEELTLEIAGLRGISREQRDSIYEEFSQLYKGSEYITEGGIGYAQEVLEKATGKERAQEILDGLTADLEVRPFDRLRKSDPGELLSFIRGEHPQTIAVILAHLSSRQAAEVLQELEPTMQAEVARRMAVMERTSPDVIAEIESVLETKLSSVMRQDSTEVGGLDAVVEVLNNVDRQTEKGILDHMEEDDPELAEEINQQLLVFEDLLLLDDRSMQRVLREIDTRNDLPMALKSASEDLKDSIFGNMSQRAAQDLRESMEYLGPVRLREIEEAQQNIIRTVRELEEQNEILIARGGEEELIV